MSYLERVRAELVALDAKRLRRTIRPRGDELDFSSNDYLGLARDPAVIAAAAPQTTVGSGGSRLLAGAHDEHAFLEAELASFLGRERALLFSSGYLAALGAVQSASLVTHTAYSDRENHACIIDALRLSKLQRTIFQNLPPQAHDGPATIVSETLFSMSGRTIDLAALLGTAGADDIVILDEAHALGVIGPHGAGVAAGFGDPRIVIMGSLSKAFGCAAGPAPFIELLMSTARTFIFDTSLPPSLARAARVALGLIRSGDARRVRLRALLARLKAAVPAITADGPIVPLHVGSSDGALAYAGALRERGIIAPAIRPPTVAPGHEQLRITIRADHTDAEIDRLAAALLEIVR